MTFKEIQEIFKSKFGVTRLADIARELDVTPQVVSNWKARNQLPYKYVKKLNEKIKDNEKKSNGNIYKDPITIIQPASNNPANDEADFNFISFLKDFYPLISKNLGLIAVIPSVFAIITAIYVLYFVNPTFETIIKVIPSQSSQNPVKGLAGISSQLGIGAPGNDLSSGIYYPDLIMSRKLHENILDQKFHTKKIGEKRTLLSILTGAEKNTFVKSSSTETVAKAIKSLFKSIVTSPSILFISFSILFLY